MSQRKHEHAEREQYRAEAEMPVVQRSLRPRCEYYIVFKAPTEQIAKAAVIAEAEYAPAHITATRYGDDAWEVQCEIIP